MGRSPCSVEGCERPIKGRQLCDAHRARLIQYGDVRADDPIRPINLPILDRIMAKTEVVGDCWIWTGHTSRGYAKVNIGQRPVRAHIWMYEHHHGSVPEGLELDHTCTKRACVNPAHLEPVTHEENLRRMREHRRLLRSAD